MAPAASLRLSLILLDALILVITANVGLSSSVAPAPSPTTKVRPLGERQDQDNINQKDRYEGPSPRPGHAPLSSNGAVNSQHHDLHQETSYSDETTTSTSETRHGQYQSPVSVDHVAAEKRQHHGHHLSSHDKSVAGGGVIVACLVSAFFVAVFCYIRATKRSRFRSDFERTDHDTNLV